jgi:hypothetical protein
MVTTGVSSALGSSWVVSVSKVAEGEIQVESAVCEPG